MSRSNFAPLDFRLSLQQNPELVIIPTLDSQPSSRLRQLAIEQPSVDDALFYAKELSNLGLVDEPSLPEFCVRVVPGENKKKSETKGQPDREVSYALGERNHG